MQANSYTLLVCTQFTLMAFQLINLVGSYWQVSDNRKRFFDSFATRKEFDPLIAFNWYSVSSTDVMEEKGGNSIMAFYGKSLAQALTTVYPNIGLQQANFSHAPRKFYYYHYICYCFIAVLRDTNPTIDKYYHDIANQRAFFDDFAAKQGFDPLISHNWYSVSTVEIKLEKVIINSFS